MTGRTGGPACDDPSMRITKYTHSCVRLERDGAVLVIDPGIWSEPRALRDADAVLVTHEHVDHVDVLRLRGLQVPVFAPADAHIPDLAVTRINADEQFVAAGFKVIAVGGRHATVSGGEPSCANVGYVIEDALYHPGDALDLPAQSIEALLVPMQAAWLKTGEAIDFVRTIAPRLAIGIHDAQINQRGRSSINSWLEEETGTDYRWLSPGTALDA